ncbi:DUF3145 domain-containing protein [Tessaracoccus flavus]|uniref:Uncharacterized protein n=1 Tax=Tessaracoccus flavus TaxID=1610493 RepID=A0A1Q2CDW4_9ACTN|nr:DUF3145 domain-containing protein [Tessaracoccus flavus]AQP44281.1 hypothetical protein RPIT_05190 [Tessaracoccus flavus]SDY40543.1 Protein of unknown function [Tessaracoccus flavus]
MSARLDTNSNSQARGMIFVHSAPAALCPHIEWAIGAALNGRPTLTWTAQPAESGSQRAELSWASPIGTGAAIASSLQKLGRVRFEVTEEPSAGSDGQRYCFTPSLGAFSAVVGVHGDILVPEDRLKHAVATDALGGEPIYKGLERLLGVPWDEELDVFRHASEDAPVRWLHQVV